MKKIEDIIQNLKDAGCSEQQMKDICSMYEDGRIQDMIRSLRCHRCRLMDQLHESQSKVDCLDFLVYQIEKEQKIR